MISKDTRDFLFYHNTMVALLQGDDFRKKIHDAYLTQIIDSGLANRKPATKNNKELRLILTQNCNYQCFFCHKEGIKEKSEDKLTVEDYVYLYNACKDEFGWQTVSLSGGEPLLYKNLGELISGIAEQKGEITIVSNGELLDKYMDTVKKLKQINLSLHSLDPKTYEKITGHPTLSKVISNIDMVKKEAPHVDLRLNMVLNKGLNDSVNDIRDFVKFAGEKDCSAKFIELSGKGHVPNADVFNTLESLGAKYKNSSPRGVNFLHGETRISLMRCACDHARKGLSPSIDCADTSSIIIGSSGNMIMCTRTGEHASLLDDIKNKNTQELVSKIGKLNSAFGGRKCIFVDNKTNL